MNPEELIEIVEGRGLRLKLTDGKPFVVGDPTLLTPVLANALKANRKEMIEYLQRNQAETQV